MNHDALLPIELAEPVLISLLRHFTLPATDKSSTVVHPALNTISRILVPDITRAALIKLWWYSLDDIPPCSTSWLLPMLLDLEQRYARPLIYSVQGLGNAARSGDFATMDAWIDAGLLNELVLGDDGSESTEVLSLHMARYDGAEGEFMIEVWDWWLKRGLPWGAKDAIEVDLMIASSSSAVTEDVCVRALDWWHAQKEMMVESAPSAVLVAACRAGYVRVLDWWWAHFESSFACTAEMMDAAVEGGGHLPVLQWWVEKFPLDAPLASNPKKRQAVVLRHTADLASRHGHVRILEWWFDSTAGLSKSYRKRTEAAIDHAAANGHISVLDFWLTGSTHADEHRRLSFRYKHALDWACTAGRIQVLEWFAKHGQVVASLSKPCPLLFWPGRHARSITVECLEWRRLHTLQTRFAAESMAMLSKDGRLDILEWISGNNIEFESGLWPVAEASGAGNVFVLDWWLKELGHDKFSAELASNRSPIAFTCHLPVLQWLAEMQIDLLKLGLSMSPYMRDPQLAAWAIDCAGANADVVVRECIDLCVADGEYEPVEWCLRTHPAAARQALSLARLRYRLDKVQFGIFEFLVRHELLPVAKSDEHTLLADSVDEGQVSSLIYSGGGGHLALLDWIHRHYQPDPTDQAHVFALTPANLTLAIESGNLGLLRWIKGRKVEIRQLGVDGDEFGSDLGVGDW